MIRHTTVPHRLGELTFAADDRGVTGIWFDGHWHPPTPQQLGERVDDDPLWSRVATKLDEYLDRRRQTFDLPISLHGSTFELQVWHLIEQIPYGERRAYGDLARELGGIGLSQRVGQCVGRNPISIVIPCHRVVGSDGSLTGYAGGVERKRMLLDLESPIQADRLF